MKIISVANQKGGCGKTITAVNLSAALSKKGHKVLLIDFDPQAHATFALGGKSNFTITDILEKIHNKEVPDFNEAITPISDNFYFIGASIGLIALEHHLALSKNKLTFLSSALKGLPSNYDYCILDCPPNLGVLTLNALNASAYCLTPISICDFSLHGLKILKNIFIMLKEFNNRMPTPLYLLNQLDKRSRFSKDFIERAKSTLGDFLLNTSIRTNIHLREAAAAGKDIINHKPASRGAEDFMNLAREVENITTSTSWTTIFLKDKKFQDVHVVGDFTNWEKDDQYKLKKISKDIWSIKIPLGKGKYRYKFVEGKEWFTDPHNSLTENDSFGGRNSLLYVE
ncbi:MAG: AAA family ATPase [Candidatus Omnitrophica bacterium]|nr:AAA family ATPase [Candidatus Omnitrophota bacterium]